MKTETPIEIAPNTKENLLGVFLGYTKYIEELASNNNIPSILNSSRITIKENILELEYQDLLEYSEKFSSDIKKFVAENHMEVSPPTIQEFSENEFDGENTDYINSKEIDLMVNNQEFFKGIKAVQAIESKNNNLEGDSPSIFVFVKYDHRQNLFTYQGEVDKGNPEIIHGLEGIDTIFDIEGRVETAFIIKRGCHGLYEMRTGNYNELANQEFINELRKVISEENDPLYPFFFNIGLEEKSFDKYDCTRNMCAEFLNPDCTKSSSLKLIELDTDGVESYLQEDKKGAIFYCDAKDTDVVYMMKNKELLKFEKSLSDANVSLTTKGFADFANNHALILEDGREFEIVDNDYMEDRRLTAKPQSPSKNEEVKKKEIKNGFKLPQPTLFM